METQRKNFKVNIINNEEVHINDIVQLVDANGNDTGKMARVVEINGVEPTGKTTYLNRKIYQVTGVVQLIDDITEDDNEAGMVSTA